MSIADLLKYGYAPGNYMGRCRTCHDMHIDLDKRAITCLACAEKRYAEDQLKPAPEAFTLKPCPFCGHQPDEDNLADSIHPQGRTRDLWTVTCVDNEGGCNASVLGSSREHAIALWNARAGQDRAHVNLLNIEQSKPSQRYMIVCSICGNKRCPHAESKLFKCTNSNDVGQIGEPIDS